MSTVSPYPTVFQQYRVGKCSTNLSGGEVLAKTPRINHKFIKPDGSHIRLMLLFNAIGFLHLDEFLCPIS